MKLSEELKTPLIFELSKKGRNAYSLPKPFGEKVEIPDFMKRRNLNLPEVSEPEVIRHFIHLSRRNFGVDSGFYPLGSCTMKYNPKLSEEIAFLKEITEIHPYQDENTVQGSLELMYKLSEFLKKLSGMDAITLQPAAGAHGELCGCLIMKAYHKDRGEERDEVIVPDSAHGTNPASASMVGFKVIEIPSNENGMVDLEALKAALSEKTAGLLLTNPNTLGLFEEDILEISNLVHKAGGLLYYDGANLNAIMGICRPEDMGFDLLHFNLHKSFSTPHGGGGPGAGPVGVKKFLREFLPVPIVERKDKKYYLEYDLRKSIGKLKGFYGNFQVLVKAYAYILSMGSELQKASELAVLNANYLYHKLKEYYEIPFKPLKKHEFVLSCERIRRETGVRALDIAKRLLDYEIYAPTIYFPLIVKEAMMIEPTETESRETLQRFADVMIHIHKECYENPDVVKSAPHKTPIKRLDDVRAAREPILSWRMYRKSKTLK
ncbi:MAG: aminomethyl-transferring glycine dehydrogenase subunit GcvPB [Candidatus Methanofastidiosia archaeon]